MALAALIPACRTVDGGERLCATLPLAGRTLIEHQVRLAARAGAAPVVVLVERVPVALVEAIDRLRRDGIKVELARGLDDAVDRIHPDEALLLMADGVVAPRRLVTRVARSRWHLIVTVPDDAAHKRFERIDAGGRWGGLLLVDGLRLRQVAGMLGDWDLESTLLRSAVQAGAERMPAGPEMAGGTLLLVERDGELAALDAELAAGVPAVDGDWLVRFVYPPVAQLLLPPLLRRGIDPGLLPIGAATASWFAAAFALAGWRWVAFLLLLLCGPAAALGEGLAAVRMADIRQGAMLARLRLCGAAAALIAFAWTQRVAMGWGIWPLCLGLLAALAALAGERRLLERTGADRVPPWIGGPDAAVWALLPFALAGRWLAGLGVAALYAAFSFAALQYLVARALSVPPEVPERMKEAQD